MYEIAVIKKIPVVYVVSYIEKDVATFYEKFETEAEARRFITAKAQYQNFSNFTLERREFLDPVFTDEFKQAYNRKFKTPAGGDHNKPHDYSK